MSLFTSSESALSGTAGRGRTGWSLVPVAGALAVFCRGVEADICLAEGFIGRNWLAGKDGLGHTDDARLNGALPWVFFLLGHSSVGFLPGRGRGGRTHFLDVLMLREMSLFNEVVRELGSNVDMG